MYGDPGILCFQHCRKDAKIFCFELPSHCVLCKGDLHKTELRIPPFRVPYPFCRAVNKPNAVVIKPTCGDFLHNYQNSSDLHIGVTDSKGRVYEYDVDGIIVSNGKEWNECLSVQVCKKTDAVWREYWDYTLNIVYQQDEWTAKKYNTADHNCYSFVLVFLRTLQLPELKPCLVDKTQFCKDFVVPHTRVAGKYISLYRQLQKDGIKVQQ